MRDRPFRPPAMGGANGVIEAIGAMGPLGLWGGGGITRGGNAGGGGYGRADRSRDRHYQPQPI